MTCFPSRCGRPFLYLIASAALCATTSPALAGVPVSGVPVPNLAAFDDAMITYMEDYNIDEGVLAVSHDGCIVYQRGFGVSRYGVTTPENTPMRIASLEKTITAAAIRILEADGAVSLFDHIFDLDQADPGILPNTPWDGLGDDRLEDVTIFHALNHRGGWNRDTAGIGDPMFKAIQIAADMGIASPPNRDQLIRYMLSEPLQFTPGTAGCGSYCYSNFGYLLIGRIIERRSGLSLLDFVRQRVLTPNMWVPSTEIFFGQSQSQNFREPVYDNDGGTCSNVFNPLGPHVLCPYGGWQQEWFVGHGNLVASAAPLLIYMDHYQVNVGGDCGTPLNGSSPHGASHTGQLRGTSTLMRQFSTENNIVVLFPADGNSTYSDNGYAADMGAIITNVIADGVTWPTTCVDGTWIDFEGFFPLSFGSYNYPYFSIATGIGGATDGTRIRLKPGSTNWTGTINKRLRIDAPFGTAIIGQD
ncbi:MAG: serine hydrolase [Phycisphaerales bacterium]|nr:serine hydrolase [Phycisphaerales bacterium]